MRLLFASLLFITAPAHALVTAYASFDHPDGWRCELSQGVWICQSTVESERKESVVLSIATLASEWDTLENYEEYLKQPKNIQDEDGNTITSKVAYVRKRNINGTTWIDSLQSNSELPGFWSRYLATVHNKLAILITYIVSEEKYKSLAPKFEQMVSSLKPNAEFDLNIATRQGESPIPGGTKLGPVKELVAERLGKGGLPKRTAAEDGKASDEEEEAAPGEELPWAAIALGLAAGVGFWILRRRRRKVTNKKHIAPKEPTIKRP